MKKEYENLPWMFAGVCFLVTSFSVEFRCIIQIDLSVPTYRKVRAG